jgi:hypothetical protein
VSPATARAAWLVGCVAALSIAALLFRTAAPIAFRRVLRIVESKKVWLPASLAIIAAFVALQLVSTVYPGYIDQAEPHVGSVSWLVLKGAPLYHSANSPDRYSLQYGPAYYLPFVAALWLGGGTLVSIKSLLLLVNLTTLYFLWKSLRTILDAPRALLGVAFVLLFLHVPRPNSYFLQVRGDALVVCAISAGLYAASMRSGLAGPLILALTVAFVMDTKISGVFYVLPLVVQFAVRRGWRAAFAVGLCSIGAAALPFLLPNVSGSEYWRWLHRAGGHPKSTVDLFSTLRTLPILVAPLLLLVGPTPWRHAAFRAHVRENGLRLLTLLLCVAAVTAVSSIVGAGAHHLVPLVPVLGYEYASIYARTGAEFANQHPVLFRYLWACVALVVVVRVGGGVRETFSIWSNWGWSRNVTDELDSIIREYPGRQVQMGYGDRHDRLAYFRPELVFATNRLVLDEQAICEMDLDGIQLPDSTLDAVDACVADVWLIPKGQSPFSLDNVFGVVYAGRLPRHPLFGASFRDAFARHYKKGSSAHYFDLWVCDEPSRAESRSGFFAP